MSYQASEPVDRLSLSQSAWGWAEMVHRVQDGDMTCDAPYQRGHAWTTEQRMLLIYSILSGTPIPALIINCRPESMWFAADGSELPGYAVIDGKQRITTVRMFMESHLAVPASWFRAEDVIHTEDTADGPYVRWRGLSLPCQRHFGHFPIGTADGRLGGIREEAELYLRVNGAGTPQTDEDMARAARVAGAA